MLEAVYVHADWKLCNVWKYRHIAWYSTNVYKSLCVESKTHILKAVFFIFFFIFEHASVNLQCFHPAVLHMVPDGQYQHTLQVSNLTKFPL